MQNIACVNTNITYSSGVSLPWDLGSGASPQNITGASVTTQYSTTGRKNIIYGADTYTGFANIIQNGATIPVAGTNAPLVSGNYRVCAGTPVSFSALNPGLNYVYSWDMGGGSIPNTYSGTGFQTVNNAVFNTPGTYTISLNYTTDCCGLSPAATITLIVDPQPVVAIAGAGAYCANSGASLNLTASGASTYTWSPGSGLNTTTGTSVIAYPTSTTTYTVTGVNAFGNCFATSNVTVTVNDVALSPTFTAATCGANGTAAANPSGGSGSYAYIWAPGGQTTATIAGVPAATYNVTVTDLVTGCVSNASVGVPAGPGVAVATISNTTQVDCNGSATGNATVSVSGGVGPFAYNWTPAGGGAATTTALPAGTYAVQVIDFGNPGCPTGAVATITQPNPLTSSVLSTDSATCGFSDGSATVNAYGGSGPYTYNWGFGTGATQTGLATGVYTVTITDSRGCQTTQPVTIDCILPVEMAYLEANPYNASIRLDWATTQEINNQRFDVQRSEDGVGFVKIGQVASTVGTGPGTDYSFVDAQVVAGLKYYYRLEQFDLDGRSHLTNVVWAVLPEANVAQVKTVYPNPFEDVVNISLTLQRDVEIRLEVHNTLGQPTGHSKTYNLNAGTREMKLDLRDLPAGVYIAKMYSKDAQVGSVRLVKAN